jgi:hypothetical protein
MPGAAGVAPARDGRAAELIKANALAGALDAQVGVWGLLVQKTGLSARQFG